MPETVILNHGALQDFASRLLQSAGTPRDEADAVAESLLDANLRGHESHGVVRVPDYVEQLRLGELRARAELESLSETASLFVGDAHYGFGQVQCRKLIDRLEPKAREQGVACGTLKNCGHVGRLAEWVERAAARGLAGFISVNDNGVLKCVAPPGGVEAKISTNPLAIGVPTGNEPLAFDISTSIVANGKVKVAQLAGRKCPPGWLQDHEGNPTTDPHTRFTEPNSTLLPFDGEHGYKAFGLGLMLDMLVGGLTGGYCPPAPTGIPVTNNVLLVLWDPARFAGMQHFQDEADKLIHSVRTTRRKPGVDAIRLPNDRSSALRLQRLQKGVPLDGGTWSSLTALADAKGVSTPAASIVSPQGSA